MLDAFISPYELLHQTTQRFQIMRGAGRASEEWIPGLRGGTSGGTFVDMTATYGASVVRIQTVTTLADAITPNVSEAAAARICKAFPNDQLRFIPKRRLP